MDLNLVENIGNDKNALSSAGKRAVNPDNVPTFNGLYQAPDAEPVQPFDAKESMKMMNENIKLRKVNDSRVPDAIKNSIMQNPLMMNESGVGSEMDTFTERLGKKLDGMDGIRKSMGILEASEAMDRSKNVDRMIQEAPVTRSEGRAGGGVDYEIIKAIVESAIDKKLGSIKQVLNESAGRTQPGLSVMRLSDKFLFLDDDDNIYECEMKYKGKNKRKKKS